MSAADLGALDRAVAHLLLQEPVRESIEQLKLDLRTAAEPFVWSVVDVEPLTGMLPPEIRSAWIFVLRSGAWTGAHYHPNSVQHMVMIEGVGRSRIAGRERRMIPYGANHQPPERVWHVIDPNVPHEFFPEGTDLVVLSFHTCAADELEEIESRTGKSRFYEPRR